MSLVERFYLEETSLKPGKQNGIFLGEGNASLGKYCDLYLPRRFPTVAKRGDLKTLGRRLRDVVTQNNKFCMENLSFLLLLP